VKYTAGKLVAKGRRNGKTLETSVETTGAPAAIVLEPDRKTLAADGADISLVTVKIVDEQGRTVPVASNMVTFNVSGAGQILGVGNGNPVCHESDKGNQRSAFNGLCLAIVQSTRAPGAISVQADSPGLKSAQLAIKSRRVHL
jgi:beta-galactosidase